jgi:hypothetical protein
MDRVGDGRKIEIPSAIWLWCRMRRHSRRVQDRPGLGVRWNTRARCGGEQEHAKTDTITFAIVRVLIGLAGAAKPAPSMSPGLRRVLPMLRYPSLFHHCNEWRFRNPSVETRYFIPFVGGAERAKRTRSSSSPRLEFTWPAKADLPVIIGQGANSELQRRAIERHFLRRLEFEC